MTVYTHGHHESVLRSHRWRTAENSAAHLLPHLRPGQRLLDVGCGPGTITLDLAARLGPTGSVTAVEVTAEALGLARAEAARRGAGGIESGIESGESGTESTAAVRVEFLVADVHALPLRDASYDHGRGPCLTARQFQGKGAEARGFEPRMGLRAQTALAVRRHRPD